MHKITVPPLTELTLVRLINIIKENSTNNDKSPSAMREGYMELQEDITAVSEESGVRKGMDCAEI